MYNCIVFDIDGTLLDTEAALVSSLQRLVLEELNRNLTPSELRFAFGIPGEDTLRRLGVPDLRRSCQKWIEYFNECSHNVRLFDGIQDTLARLFDEGILMGIVTSKTREEFTYSFSPFGLDDYFRVVVCADDTEQHKPCPEPVLKFLELAGVDKSKTMYVGDTAYDAECALGAGVAFGLALWGAGKSEGIPATHVLQNPAQILELVEK
ncbi:MAG: HAD family hydrolase [Ignavibacteriales bacterium]